MKKIIIVISAVILIFILANYLIFKPMLYSGCSNSNGLTLKVYRERNPGFIGVDVLVEIETIDGQAVYSKVIYNLDMWNDIKGQFDELICKTDHFLIGPQWWDGNQNTFYRIDVSELKP